MSESTKGTKEKRKGWGGQNPLKRKQTEKSLPPYKISTKSIFIFPNFTVLTPVNWFKIITFHQYRRIEGKGISVQLTLYTKKQTKNPLQKSLPFGVIRLQHNLLVGPCLARTNAPESRS